MRCPPHSGTSKESVQLTPGPYDVIAVVEAEDFTELGGIFTTKIAPVSGVSRWVVCATLSQVEEPARARK